jgi:hypothetical protein
MTDAGATSGRWLRRLTSRDEAPLVALPRLALSGSIKGGWVVCPRDDTLFGGKGDWRRFQGFLAPAPRRAAFDVASPNPFV